MNVGTKTTDWIEAAVIDAQNKADQSKVNEKLNRVTRVAGAALNYSRKDKHFYQLGHNTAIAYLNGLEKPEVKSFITKPDVGPIVKKLAELRGFTGKKFHMFKQGFFDLIIHLKEDLVKEDLLHSTDLSLSSGIVSDDSPSSLEEYVIAEGVKIAQRYYEDTSNLSSLVALSRNEFDLNVVFHDYMKTSKLYLQYVDPLPGDPTNAVGILNIPNYEACMKGFKREMSAFFNREKGRFEALGKDPAELANDINAEKMQVEEISGITKEALETLKDSPGNSHYKMGIASAMKYFENLAPAMFKVIETYNFSRVIEKKGKETGLRGKRLQEFKKGFNDTAEGLRNQLKKDGCFYSTPLEAFQSQNPEEIIKGGVEIAQEFLQSSSHRSLLAEAYCDKTKLRKIFDDYVFNKDLRLICSSPEASEIDKENMAIGNSLMLGLFYNGFLQEISAYFEKNKLAFDALNEDEAVLAAKINGEPEKVEAKKKKKKKNTKKSPAIAHLVENSEGPFVPVEPKKSEEPKVIQLPRKKTPDEKRAKYALLQKNNFSALVLMTIRNNNPKDESESFIKMIKAQEEKVRKTQSYYDSLTEDEKKSDVKKVLDSAIDVLTHFENEYKKVIPMIIEKKESLTSLSPSVELSAPAAANVHGNYLVPQESFVRVSRYHETGKFSVEIHNLVRAILRLENKDGILIELSGSFTDLQMQTLKICLIYMIQNGVFNDRPGILSFHPIIADLNRAFPDNRHTHDVNNQLILNQRNHMEENHLELNPYDNAISVLECAGFKFSV